MGCKQRCSLLPIYVTLHGESRDFLSSGSLNILIQFEHHTTDKIECYMFVKYVLEGI